MAVVNFCACPHLKHLLFHELTKHPFDFTKHVCVLPIHLVDCIQSWIEIFLTEIYEKYTFLKGKVSGVSVFVEVNQETSVLMVTAQKIFYGHVFVVVGVRV